MMSANPSQASNPNTRRPLRVFLCHSSADKPTVRDLYQRLKAEQGIDPWLDEEKLLPGQNWDLEIRKAIETTDVVVVCLSQSSITKVGYVNKEIKKALDIADEQPEGTIFIIPLKLEPCTMPYRLRGPQWVDYFEPRGYERFMLALTAPTLPEETSDGGAGGTTTSDAQRMISELNRALERDPKSVRAYAQRGDAYLLLREYRRAIADFDHALELAPQDASLYAKRGEAYLLLREYRRAITDFDRALELEPGNETIRTKRNEASLELTRPQQALAPPLVSRHPLLPTRVKGRTILLIGLALLVIASGVVALFSLIHANQVTTDHANATATAQAANANATATASVIAASPNHYGGTLAINDPLRDNSRGYGWSQGRDRIGDCEFIGGAYHDIDINVPNYDCYVSRDFTNFAFQVDMQINRGLNGGIVFGADRAAETYLNFEVSEDGRFDLSQGQHLTINSALVNVTTTSVIIQGFRKTNTIAVVVKRQTITLYINKTQVAKVVDSAYSHGSIGVLAGALMGPTGYSADVAYTNAKVWIF